MIAYEFSNYRTSTANTPDIDAVDAIIELAIEGPIQRAQFYEERDSVTYRVVNGGCSVVVNGITAVSGPTVILTYGKVMNGSDLFRYIAGSVKDQAMEYGVVDTTWSLRAVADAYVVYSAGKADGSRVDVKIHHDLANLMSDHLCEISVVQ